MLSGCVRHVSVLYRQQRWMAAVRVYPVAAQLTMQSVRRRNLYNNAKGQSQS